MYNRSVIVIYFKQLRRDSIERQKNDHVNFKEVMGSVGVFVLVIIIPNKLFSASKNV